uniref:Nucleoprotein n=1 Tax=Soybean thrips thogotovirus 1 TaxID=2797871 RepID=A0A7T7WM37_9ORTO|nr:nucleoprotein [Soybean thrips thogotovirus 1]
MAGRGGFIPDKKLVTDIYAFIRKTAIKYFPASDLKMSYNAEVVGALITAMMDDPELKAIKTGKLVLVKSVTNGLVKEEVAYQLEDFRKEIKEFVETKGRDKVRPILYCVKMAEKSWDEIIYHDAKVSKDLQLPKWCEIFAAGKNLAGKMKKARALSTGPLVHLQSLISINNYTGNIAKFPHEHRAACKKKIVTALNKQMISENQRKIVSQIADGKLENMGILVASWATIKPHVEHHYALPPAVIIICEEDLFKDDAANMSGVFIIYAWHSFLSQCKFTCPLDWVPFIVEIYFHRIFNTWKDDLGVVDFMYPALSPSERKEMPGTYGKVDTWVVRTALPISKEKFVRFAKPQKGAPRNLGPSSSSQLCNVVTIRGKRKAHNFVGDLPSASKVFKTDSNNLIEALQVESNQYRELEHEGTSTWYKVSYHGVMGDEGFRIEIAPCNDIYDQPPRFMFGTPSQTL